MTFPTILILAPLVVIIAVRRRLRKRRERRACACPVCAEVLAWTESDEEWYRLACAIEEDR
jgi:hypothetical protein